MKNGLQACHEVTDLSQDEFAEAVDVIRQIINTIERERYDPSLKLAFKLAACFDCRVEDLFDPELDANLTA